MKILKSSAHPQLKQQFSNGGQVSEEAKNNKGSIGLAHQHSLWTSSTHLTGALTIMFNHDNRSNPHISISISAAGYAALTILALLLGLGSSNLFWDKLITPPNSTQERLTLPPASNTLPPRQS